MKTFFLNELEYNFEKLRNAKSAKNKTYLRGVIHGYSLAMMRLDFINVEQVDRITIFTCKSEKLNLVTLNKLAKYHKHVLSLGDVEAQT